MTTDQQTFDFRRLYSRVGPLPLQVGEYVPPFVGWHVTGRPNPPESYPDSLIPHVRGLIVDGSRKEFLDGLFRPHEAEQFQQYLADTHGLECAEVKIHFPMTQGYGLDTLSDYEIFGIPVHCIYQEEEYTLNFQVVGVCVGWINSGPRWTGHS